MSEEYISREAAIKVVCEDCNRLFPEEPCEPSDCELMNVICAIPAADVRPVTFCKDCDHWNDWDSSGSEKYGNLRCSCAYWTVEEGPTFYTAPTDFCSYAESKERL